MGTYKISNKKRNGQPVWVNKDRSGKIFYTSGQPQEYLYFSPLSLFVDGTWMIGTPWDDPRDYDNNKVGIRSAEQEQGNVTVPVTGWQYLNVWQQYWVSEANLTVTRKIFILNEITRECFE